MTPTPDTRYYYAQRGSRLHRWPDELERDRYVQALAGALAVTAPPNADILHWWKLPITDHEWTKL